MNIGLSVKDLHVNDIFFLEPVKNIIINNSNFIRIIYSNELFTLNGIYLLCNIDLKNKCNNYGLLIYIQSLEYDILNKYSNNKIKNYKIREYFNTNFLPSYRETQSLKESNDINKENYTLKISGIWEANNIIGLTFKFLKLDSILSIR